MLDFFHFGVQFYVLLSPYLCFISFFISSFIYPRRRCMDKIGVFHADQTSMYLDPHLNKGWGWPCETGLSSPVKYFY